MKLFGICGRKQSGKDSVANFMQQLLPHLKIQKLSFAKPLKDFINQAFDIPTKNLWGSDSDKNHPLCTWGEVFKERALQAYKKVSTDLLSAREILQIVGTDVMRQGHMEYLHNEYQIRCAEFLNKKFGNPVPRDSTWIDLMKKDIDYASTDNDIVIIPDVRFVNEVITLQNWDAILVRLYRDSQTTDSIPHPSELEMDKIGDEQFNHVVYEYENKDLKQLKKFTTRILMYESLIHTGGESI